MNSFLKKALASLMVGLVTIYALPLYTFAKDENVYSKINTQGETYKTIVTTKDMDKVEQTETDKELPLEMKITYTLDGKQISADELAGKSGKVVIKIEYINKSAQTVNINGREETMYTPFVVAVGSIIDNENNKNIKVTNGKVVENGNKSIVFGVVMPGLDESLDLSGVLGKIDIPSSIEITMETKTLQKKYTF